jgi:hypothetical protein
MDLAITLALAGPVPAQYTEPWQYYEQFVRAAAERWGLKFEQLAYVVGPRSNSTFTPSRQVPIGVPVFAGFQSLQLSGLEWSEVQIIDTVRIHQNSAGALTIDFSSPVGALIVPVDRTQLQTWANGQFPEYTRALMNSWIGRVTSRGDVEIDTRDF